MVLPFISAKGLPGKRDEPKRAGMMPIAFKIVYKVLKVKSFKGITIFPL